MSVLLNSSSVSGSRFPDPRLAFLTTDPRCAIVQDGGKIEWLEHLTDTGKRYVKAFNGLTMLALREIAAGCDFGPEAHLSVSEKAADNLRTEILREFSSMGVDVENSAPRTIFRAHVALEHLPFRLRSVYRNEDLHTGFDHYELVPPTMDVDSNFGKVRVLNRAWVNAEAEMGFLQWRTPFGDEAAIAVIYVNLMELP